MNEAKLLNKTLEILSNDGINFAYSYLLGEMSNLPETGSQLYNYLYCLAALAEKPEEALGWLEEAIISKGFWYRPEVFEDSDLDMIHDDSRFHKCRDISNKRYLEELSRVKTICTWESVKAPNLILVLHGNQENIDLASRNWSFLDGSDYQVEYIQSSELDSYGLFRWEDEGTGPAQLCNALSKINIDGYKKLYLAGFSAGCNVILRALASGLVNCNAVLLQSPWIPVVEKNESEIIGYLLENDIGMLFICGEADEDCIGFRNFFEKVQKSGIISKGIFIRNLSHEFPGNFKDIISKYLNIN